MTGHVARALDSLSAEQRTLVDRLLPVRRVDVGTVLMQPSEHDRALLYLEEGRLSVKAGRVELREARPGDCIGVAQILGDPSRLFEVGAATEVAVRVADARSFGRIRRALPEVAAALELACLRSLAGRLEDLDTRICENAAALIRERRADSNHRFPMLGELVATAGSESRASGTAHPPIEERRQVVHYRPGEVLVREGEPPEAVLFIEQGAASVVRSVTEDVVVRLGTLGVGSAVGVTAALRGAGHLATCVATSEVAAVRMPSAEFIANAAELGSDGQELRAAAILALADVLGGAVEQVRCASQCFRLAVYEQLYEEPGSRSGDVRAYRRLIR